MYQYGPRPHTSPAHKIAWESLEIQMLGPWVSSLIRSESDDVMSGWVWYLMQDITTPPYKFLLEHNLLGNMGLTIVKPVPCLDLDVWWMRSPLPNLYKTMSPCCVIRRGRLDSGEYASMPCIRNFSGKDPCLLHALLGKCRHKGRIGALGAHLAHFRV